MSLLPISNYCPGCTHSQWQGLLWELVQERGWQDRMIGVATSGGCSFDLPERMPFPVVVAPPGQAPAVATGIKCSSPDKLVFTYQGDGDLAGVGLNALMHAALRGESITVLCLNNFVMAGMGGHLSATTPTGQRTPTTPYGRSASESGRPLKMAELVAKMPQVALSQRVSLHRLDFVKQAKLALRNAFDYQENGQGLSFVEVLGLCPPYWNLEPLEARERLEKELLFKFSPNIYRSATILR